MALDNVEYAKLAYVFLAIVSYGTDRVGWICPDA